MPPGVPRKRRHTVAKLYAVLLKPLRNLQRMGTDLRITCRVDRALHRARNDLALAVELGGMVDDAMAQQWPILHQAVHGIPLLVIRLLGRRPSPAGLKVSRRIGRRNGFVRRYGLRQSLVAGPSHI